MATYCLKALIRACPKQRFVSSLGSAVKISKRCFLSASYGQTEHLGKFKDHDKVVKDMSAICLFIDRCSERKQPFPSLTIDRMIRAIEDREDIVTSMYYLYKFRHSDSCYFLRPWTSHMWFRKCIEYDAKDLALKALDESAHYGMFPDSVALDMLLWDCLKDENYDIAFKVASHMFLLERLDLKVSQSLCLMTLLKKIMSTKDNSEESTPLPEFSSLAERRNFGGLCLRLGQLMDIRDIKLIGFGILGSIENENGIYSVYQNPWAPLTWEEGYFEKCLNLMGAEGVPVPRDVINIVLDVVKNDEESVNTLNEKISTLGSEKLISDEKIFQNFHQKLLKDISEVEKSENVLYNDTMASWLAEYKKLCDIEDRIHTECTNDREEYFAAEKIRMTAKRMAIEKLGYWEFLSDDGEKSDIKLHLREDFVQGSVSDVDIERRKETDEEYFYSVQ